MEDLQLNVEDAENRAEWRRRTRVADPSPEGSTAWRREIGIRICRIADMSGLVRRIGENFFSTRDLQSGETCDVTSGLRSQWQIKEGTWRQYMDLV